MNKIICDTNIWYYVENGIIDLKSINPKFPLCSTYLTLNELLTTPKWFSEPERVFNVIKVMLENSSIVLCCPQLYVKNITFIQKNQDLEILDRFRLCQ
jgi:hypothetical protein